MANIKELLKNVTVMASNLSEYGVINGAPKINSLECERGDIFIAICGVGHDGHDFIPIAVSRGAALIVDEKVTPFLLENSEVPYVIVENSRLAAAHIFNEYFERPGDSLILVAVTGTNGKTSTTYFLREIFKEAGYVTGVIGTVRCMIGDEVCVLSDSADSSVNSMTTPSPEKLYPMLRRMADAGVEIVFMEASSHALCQYRLDPLHFYTGVFTGLTQDHLDYHGNMEEYYLAKRKLFGLCDTAVLCIDSSYSPRIIADLKIPCFTYSANGREASFSAFSVAFDSADGISYECRDKNDNSYGISCSVAGRFTVSNTLAALSVARLFGIGYEVIGRALGKCPQIPGRMERLELSDNCDFSVFIDYAHTPDALENVLTTLLAFVPRGGRLVVMFGCGGDRDKTKRPIMGRIATTLADVTVITGDNSRSENPRSIICDILRGAAPGADCKVVERRDAAIEYVIRNRRPGDVILLAGKGHEDYEIDESGKHPFSEKDTVLRTLGV